MGLTFSKRKRLGKGLTANLSRSGLSLSKKSGPLSFNSRGRGAVRLGKGLSFRFKL